jgi:F-box/leucine-rich repeat protein 10/11
VGDKFLRDLKAPAPTTFSSRVLSSILALAEFLVSEVRILEGGSEQAKKEVKDQIPAERIKDAPAMARELRWRLRLSAGYSSDDDASQGGRKVTNGHKRKRAESNSPGLHENPARFKNFKPKYWDASTMTAEDEKIVLRGQRPGDGDNWAEGWLDTADKTDVGNEAQVNRRSETVVKVRKTSNGLERQRIERVIEEWVWERVEES